MTTAVFKDLLLVFGLPWVITDIFGGGVGIIALVLAMSAYAISQDL